MYKTRLKKIVIALTLLSLSFGSGLPSISAVESSNTQSQLNGGGYVIGYNGEILATKGDLVDYNPEISLYARDTIYWSWGKWTWATSLELNGTKTALSNFTHYSLYHTATAIVGPNQSKKAANANIAAIAQVNGKGTAEVYYNY